MNANRPMKNVEHLLSGKCKSNHSSENVLYQKIQKPLMLARKVVEKKDLTPHMLLVGMNTGSAHVENCMAFSQKKINHR